MSLSRTRLRRAEEVLFQISSQTEDERAAAMARLRREDRDLANEVESLLDHDERLGDFLEQPALGAAFTLLPTAANAGANGDEPRDEMLGRIVGRYRIERRIASGGMGTIYLAERADEQFTQRVALKIVKRGMDTDEILQRFRRERQTLAALEHPNIARLIDGGALEGGQPYLVMEFVEGEPIDAYCDRLRLGVDARLGLFLTVCDAVRHAHQNLVVHRDLKPSNILVTADGTPKLLDFGIATVLDAAGARDATRGRDRRLTPEYASPEQVAGAAVTTTSDVYSLGVILCELLTGRQPYRFTTRTAEEVQRIVSAFEPSAPSALARRADSLALGAARSRGTTPKQLARRLRGDLDTIVLAALRKEPARRYSSVDRLAADVRRHLDRLVVSARRDTLAYRATRFAQRHSLATALAGLSLTLLVAGGGAFAWQARVAEHQRDRAILARSNSEAITAFLQNTLESADPSRSGASVTVREVMDDAARRLDVELNDQPLIRASLRNTIGRTYLSLGLYDEAEDQFREALRVRREWLGPREREVAQTMADLASVLYAVNSFDEAALLLEEALAIFQSEREPANADAATALCSLGAVKRAQGKLDEAERFQREALELRRRIHGGESLDEAESLNNLANVLSARGRPEEARLLLEDALRIRRGLLGETHRLVAQSTGNLAVLMHQGGSLDGAEPLYRKALELELWILGPEHPDVAVTRRNLALLLVTKGELTEAEDLLRRCLAAREKLLSASDSRVAMTMFDLADLLAKSDRGAEASELVEAALEATMDSSPESRERVMALTRGAAVFERLGWNERAEELREQLTTR